MKIDNIIKVRRGYKSVPCKSIVSRPEARDVGRCFSLERVPSTHEVPLKRSIFGRKGHD